MRDRHLTDADLLEAKGKGSKYMYRREMKMDEIPNGNDRTATEDTLAAKKQC